MRPIDADALHEELKALRESPWFNEKENGVLGQAAYQARRDALIVVENLVIDNAPTVEQPTVKNREEIALNIACDLLNGAVLYGYDYDRIFEEILKSEGCVTSILIKEYILDHIEELGKEYFPKGGEEND